jgi:hypothetical protein
MPRFGVALISAPDIHGEIIDGIEQTLESATNGVDVYFIYFLLIQVRYWLHQVLIHLCQNELCL